MDVSGWSADRRHRFHRFDVASFTVSKAFDRELWPSLWIVFGAQELGEFLIRRKDVVVNHFCDLIGQMFLSASENSAGNFLVGSRNGFAATMPSHWPGNLSSTSLGGISPSFSPWRITSVVCSSTRGIWRNREM